MVEHAETQIPTTPYSEIRSNSIDCGTQAVPSRQQIEVHLDYAYQNHRWDAA